MKNSWLRLFRLLALVVLALGVMAFDSCNDDPLLDSGGGAGCGGSHCSARVLPDTTSNPARF
jgi:hypothetical protein